MIVLPDIEKYLFQYAPVPHPVLEEMAQYGSQRQFPIIGPLVGRLLYLLVEYGHVHTILECGSGFGYSAAWMALALPENGNITCIETDLQNVEKAKSFFQKAGLLHKATFLVGDAVKILPQLTGTYDLVVNDVQKKQYPRILPLLIEKIRIGGLLVTDNILWKGEVAKSSSSYENTVFIRQYTEALFQQKSLFTTIIPLRDGVSLSIKLQTPE